MSSASTSLMVVGEGNLAGPGDQALRTGPRSSSTRFANRALKSASRASNFAIKKALALTRSAPLVRASI